MNLLDDQLHTDLLIKCPILVVKFNNYKINRKVADTVMMWTMASVQSLTIIGQRAGAEVTMLMPQVQSLLYRLTGLQSLSTNVKNLSN